MANLPLKILYVDSCADERRLVKGVLIKSKVSLLITEAATHLELVETLKSGSFQLILTDFNLPGFKELEQLSFLRQWLPETPVIVVSDLLDEHQIGVVFKQGVRYIVSKACIENLPQLINEISKSISSSVPYNLPSHSPAFIMDHLSQAHTPGRMLGHWEWEISSQTFNWSNEMYEIYGITPPVDLEKYARAVHPEDNTRFEGGITAHIKKMETGIRGYRITRPDGSICHVHEESNLLVNEAGQPEKIIGTTLDISYQKQLETALQNSEALFNSTFENAGYGMVIINPDGVIKRSNLVYDSTLGYEPGELTGKTLTDLVHPADRPLSAGMMVQLLGEERQRCQIFNRYLRKDGETIFCYTTITPALDAFNHITFFVSLIQDMTLTKNMERELIESENKFKLLFEHSADAMFLLDGEVFLDCNDAALKVLKCTHKSQVINHTALDFSPEFQPDGERSEQKALEMRKDANYKGSQRFEWLYRKADGEEFISEVSMTPVPMRGKTMYFSTWRDITGRRRAEARVQRQLQRLASLRSIDTSISTSEDITKTLKLVLEITLGELRVDAGAILLLNPKTNHLDYAASSGFIDEKQIAMTSLERGKGYPWQALLDDRLIVINDLIKAPNTLPFLARESFVAYYCAPLMAKGEMRGAMELFNRTPINADQEWLDFMETLAGQATIALDNSFLYNNLKALNEDLVNTYDITIEGWARALEMRDLETEGHSRRVTNLTINLARQMGIDEKNITHIRRGALLHDIGKMGIPDNVLFKPGPLNENEWDVMRRHPGYAFDMLSSIKFLSPALDIPYFHQERWNGSGYPCGLKGEEIPLPARIFAVVDVWDALTSKRPYRGEWSQQTAKMYLQENSNVLFDPLVVDCFLKMVDQV